MHYHILDNRAVVKHAYYGADDPQKIHCLETDRKFPNWQVGASGLLTRYVRPILEAGDSPRNIIVAHDMGREYRTGIYPDYKGQKSRQDESKSPIEIEQYDKLFVWAKNFFSALGATQIGVDKVEADDVIAWIVEQVEKVGGTCTVHTVDADLLRLCSASTCVLLKGTPYYDEDAQYEGSDTGAAPVPVRLMSLFKSICGDSSDNYKGVKGMGPVAFHRLLDAFELDGMLELERIIDSGNTDELDAAIKETGDKGLIKLKDNFADWRLGWRLANLKPELCWKPRKRKLIRPTVHKRVPNAQKTFDLLKEIGCADMWQDEYEPLMPAPFAVTAKNWHEWKDLILDSIAESSHVAFDYESSDKHPVAGFRKASTRGDQFVDNLSQELAGASFNFGPHLENVIYIPVDHADTENNLPKEVIKEILEHSQKNSRLVAHNAYFEGILSRTNLGLWLTNVEDTRVMQRYVDENSEAGLKFMSLEYLGYKQTSFEDTLASGKYWPEVHGQPAKMMCQLTLDEVFTYGTDDSLVTGHLRDLMQFLLILDGQWQQYSDFAVRPTEVLQRAYIHGSRINWTLQRRIHERDLRTIEEGKLMLREVLSKNVTGNITPGCNSLIAAERDYILRAARKKAAGNDKLSAKDVDEEGSRRLAEWRKRVEGACQYVPYREETVMPDFAFTALQVSKAAEGIGLFELEKLNHKAWAEYLEKIGAVGFKDEWKLTGPQVELVEAVTKGLALGCNNLSALRKAVEEEWAGLNSDQEGETTAKQHKLAVAETYMETLGEVIQRMAGVQPRVVPFGDPLNVGSPQQMQHLLYCKIGAPVRLRGKNVGKGRLAVGMQEAGPATDELTIQTALELDFKDPDLWQNEALTILLKVKSATTRCSLYHDKYPLWRHRDGRIHAYITQAGTDTRRPTGAAPNELQVSKRGEGKEMRSEFIPPEQDWVCVAIDFNGQEIRLMANLAQDPTMLSIYDPNDEKDLHSMTGSGIAKMGYDQFKAALDDKTNEKHAFVKMIRGKKAKGVNFGMSYGAGAGTLSRNLIVPKEEAQGLLDDTFKLYDRIQPWQKETARFMEVHGYTLTAFGTKRHANRDIFSDDSGKASRQHRQGTNATIQGTAAEMLHIVLTKVAVSGMMDRLRMAFFAPIYDEVVSWVHKDDVLAYCEEMGRYMVESTPPGHVIKQVPEYSVGCDWGNLYELGRDISPANVAKYVALALEDGKPIWEHDVLQPFDPILKNVVVEQDEDEEAELEIIGE